MKEFKQNISLIYGIEGKQWLDALPDITYKVAEKYNLTNLTPVNNMSFNYVASGYQNDKSIILKIGLNSKALAKEASCLKAFLKHAATEVIADDAGIIIMQRAVPDTTLKDYFLASDDEATEVLCAVIKELHLADVPKNHNFYNVRDLLKTLDSKLDIPDEILSQARALRDDLLSSTKKEVLLHGDLRHDNILKNGDGWLAIDPKGFIGDPAFEPAAYLCNPIPELLQEDNAREIIASRIKLLAEHPGIPEQRIFDWLYVKSVLCWVWSLDDNLDPEYWEHFLGIINN
jgi:streptomycin 6-kinase